MEKSRSRTGQRYGDNADYIQSPTSVALFELDTAKCVMYGHPIVHRIRLLDNKFM